jgi:hypothetical protein
MHGHSILASLGSKETFAELSQKKTAPRRNALRAPAFSFTLNIMLLAIDTIKKMCYSFIDILGKSSMTTIIYVFWTLFFLGMLGLMISLRNEP